MANVELASFLKSVNGRIGNFVLYNSYGKEYLRIYVKPENPDTNGQRIVRKTFGDAVRTWQSLTDDEQLKYNKKAYRLKLSGYNHYISLYMKDNLPNKNFKRDNPILLIASSRHSDSTMIGDYSVASPCCLADSLYKDYIQSAYGYAAG